MTKKAAVQGYPPASTFLPPKKSAGARVGKFATTKASVDMPLHRHLQEHAADIQAKKTKTNSLSDMSKREFAAWLAAAAGTARKS